uniref:Uncharacterized protein LOC101494448 isoform X3 n=1 Tax=Cicer arietinum TaxID=3827 RepID=A0A1S3EK41_CICAR|nr:uncharacterized protein LOC101494448 isoform X3 [Cicer arietinum]
MEKEGLGSTEKGVWDGESVFVVARFACIIIKLNINIYLWRMNACAQISRYSKNSCQLLYFENQNRDTCIQIFSSLLQGLLSFPFILQSTTIHYLSKLLPVATFMNQKNGNYFGVLYYEIIHLTKLSHSVGSSSCCRGLLLQRKRRMKCKRKDALRKVDFLPRVLCCPFTKYKTVPTKVP